nr:ARID DNA-binding domain-containing protein [Tanacetum cinerariifolium]
MLLMRMKEIKAFNASKNTANQEEERDRKEITQKENMARCYVCKMRGHVYWKCPNKKKNDLFKHKGIKKPTYKKAADKIKYHEKVKYPEKVHVITDYMIEGTSEATWNGIWYMSSAYKHHMCPTRSLFEKLKYKFEMIRNEETEKKFIFSYGIRDAQIEAKEGTFLIPNVHYTPEVTLNIRSHDLLEEQGYVVEIRNNKCNIHYMVGRKRKEKVQERSSTYDDGLMDAVTKHNRYLEKYFESVEPKEELSLVKGLEDLKWDKDDRDLGMRRSLEMKWVRVVVELLWKRKRTHKAEIEETLKELEEGMIIKTQFGVRLESNKEEDAKQGSITDSNDFEVIV